MIIRKATLIYFLLIIHHLLYSQQNISVNNIDIEGNEFFTDSEILNFIFTKDGGIYNEAQLNLDIKNIIKNYNLNGFIDIKIKEVTKSINDDSTGIDINISLNEGQRILIGKFSIEGNRLINSETILNLITLKPGDILNQNILNLDIEQILNLYENLGYTFVQIVISGIETYEEYNNKKLNIIILIRENDRISIDKVEIEGNTTTNRDVIIRELRIEDNRSISRDELLAFRTKLENTGYFSYVETPKIYKYQDETVLRIKVREGNTNTFDGIIGYVPPNDDEDAGYITGLVNLSLRNLFGTGRNLEARWDKQIRSTQELVFHYLEPWVFNYPVNITLGFLQRIQDSSYVKRDLSSKLELFITDYFSASITGEYNRVIPSEQFQSLGNPGILVFDSRILYGGLEVEIDTRDYVYNPSKGLLFRTNYSAGLKKIYNYERFSAYNIKNAMTIHKLRADIDLYYSFFKRQTVLLSLHGVNITAPNIESSDLFRLGGIRSVRGYRDEQFPASKTIWGNLELRYSLTRKTFASVFYDAGYYFKPAETIFIIPEEKGFIFGYGAGIRIETGLGIFGVSYALGKGDGLLDGKIHFGIINDF